MEIKPEYKQKPIRSYVIRSGRMTDGQRLAFDEFWPKYGLSLFAGPLNAAAVFGNHNPLVVEVGFGMGDSLVAMAQAEPEVNFVGIEVHSPGVGRLIASAGQLGLDNLRVYMADAKDVLRDCIVDGSLHRFQLYFPDPWHKTKHHKRRIVEPEFVALVARKLASDGLIHMATDWESYARQMLRVLQANEQLTNRADGYAERPEFRPKTKFEARGVRLGHGVWDLLFGKQP
jgi:tRNA (guanine-N7-)-methyltransferase